MKFGRKKLRDIISKAIIIAHNEDTSKLEEFFRKNSVRFEVQKFRYSEAEANLPSIVKCFLNHHLAWQKVSKKDEWVLIVEADFVPVKSMMEQYTFWPYERDNTFGYLYQNSPRLISIDDGYIRAHSAGCVAYVINRYVAKVLLEFFEDEKKQYDFEKYFTFDVHLQWYCMGRGVQAYITEKQFGEHGGFASRGHIENKIPRLGRHRADRLAGKLAFEPFYCQGSRVSYIKERLFGYVIGVARFLFVRWTADTSEHKWSFYDKLAAYRLVCKRLFL